MTTSGLSPTRGGVDPGAANQQLLYDIDGEEAMEEMERRRAPWWYPRDASQV